MSLTYHFLALELAGIGLSAVAVCLTLTESDPALLDLLAAIAGLRACEPTTSPDLEAFRTWTNRQQARELVGSR